jgi:hypothetical protein
MASVNEKECEAVNIDPCEVEKIANGLARYAKRAEKLGLQIFAGSCVTQLRYADKFSKERGELIVGYVGAGHWEGGDGGNSAHPADGLLRGEI